MLFSWDSESFGMAAVEAITSEGPVIGTRAGGLPEVVIEGETGFLLPVGEVDAMANRAIEILSDDSLQRRLGRRGRELAASVFDEALIVPIYREFYDRVISGVQSPT